MNEDGKEDVALAGRTFQRRRAEFKLPTQMRFNSVGVCAQSKAPRNQANFPQALARCWSGPAGLGGSHGGLVGLHGLNGGSTSEDLTVCQIRCIVRYRQIEQETSDDACEGERGQE